ncbi:type II toxin-antitoxin system RelE/ParE family toxin [Rheinheimera sp.]|uniref:type II toxin-antitoxin system RelE/ParE family toxin n=1 Tax=Rheinheimera sp. TaxID=1869214 RepID=UPI00307F5230
MRPFTLAATTDLRDIALFTQNRWGREQHNPYLQQFDDAFWLLADNPALGQPCNEIRQGYRKFPQGSHLIFYQQSAQQQIRIIHILHKSMDVYPIVGG